MRGRNDVGSGPADAHAGSRFAILPAARMRAADCGAIDFDETRAKGMTL